MEPSGFTAEEWYVVLEGTGAASGLIMTSDMSGPLGLTKEMTASMQVLREGKWQTPFMAAFRDEVLEATKERQAEFKQIAQARQEAMKVQRPSSREEVQELGLASIKNALALVESKAGAEAAAEYRQVVWEIAEKTAAAGKEGGFLGFGGQSVSDTEQAALDAIKGVLGL